MDMHAAEETDNIQYHQLRRQHGIGNNILQAKPTADTQPGIGDMKTDWLWFGLRYTTCAT